jgi:hypothetical protein
LVHIHKVFQSLILFGDAKVEFNLKMQAVKVDDCVKTLLHIGAKENNWSCAFVVRLVLSKMTMKTTTSAKNRL